MTTIILTIVGILLAAAAALMVVYYGGDAFGAGGVKAEANSAIGKVQQVSYALQLRKASDGAELTSRTYQTNLSTLVSEGWLSPSIGDGVFTVDADGYGYGAIDHVYMAIGSDAHAGEVCRRIDLQGGSSRPGESIAAPADWKDAAARRKRYGCFRFPTGAYVVIDHV